MVQKSPNEKIGQSGLFSVKKLSKVFKKRKVVDGISFQVNRGEIVGLLGKNGAGKTTTFRMAMGMLKPDGGSVFLMEQEVTQLPMYKRARLGMGYLAQKPSIFRFLSVEDNLLAVLEHTGLKRNAQKEKMLSLIARFGLQKVQKSLSLSLSGGERRRLEIARALITEPELLLLDEPFSGVDPIAIAEIKEIIAELREEGIGILLTDHNVRETLSITDRAYIMESGTILSQGTPQAIVEDPKAREAYLGESFTLS